MHLSQDLIDLVWQKAQTIPNNNPNVYRQDYAGAWIRRDEYGKNSIYGWVIDHLMPKSLGGTDDISNLFPLQYQNSMMRADKYPRWQTAVSAKGNTNADNIRNWYVENAL